MIGTTSCGPASVAISVTPGAPTSAPPALTRSGSDFALWADRTHEAFTVTAIGGTGDCQTIASRISTQSRHHLTVTLVDPTGACLSFGVVSTYRFRLPTAIDPHAPVSVTVVHDSRSTTTTLP